MLDKINPKSLTKRHKTYTYGKKGRAGKRVTWTSKVPIWIVEKDKTVKELYADKLSGFVKGFIFASYTDVNNKVLNISICEGYDMGKTGTAKPKPLNKLVFNTNTFKGLVKEHIPDKFTKAIVLFDSNVIIGIYQADKVLSEKWSIGSNLLEEIEYELF